MKWELFHESFVVVFLNKETSCSNLNEMLLSRGVTRPVFLARVELELWVLSPDKAEPAEISLKNAMSPMGQAIRASELFR